MTSYSAARRILLRGNSRSILCNNHHITSVNHHSSRALSVVASSMSPTPTQFNDHNRPHNIKLQNYTMTMSTISTAASEHEEEDNDDTTAPRFSSLPTLHPSSLHAIEHKMKLSTMTEIQHKTFMAASSGQDILGRARTGTGKTLAFILPALENALRLGRVPGPPYTTHNNNDKSSNNNTGIAILVLSPTRELAMQIHNQAQILTSSHANSSMDHVHYAQKQSRMTSQVMFGGLSRNVDIQKLQDNCPYILVATPGRLIDHIKSSHVRGVPFREMIENVSIFVLDEADRCLDMGFRTDMDYILSHKGKKPTMEENETQQTLLFSATLPKDLRSIMAKNMRKDYLTVDCIRDVDPASHTNASVDQSFVTLPTSSSSNNDANYRYITGLVDILEDIIHIRNTQDHKVIVFFPTTSKCQFFSYLFNTIFRIPVLEIHSKKTQQNRTTVSKNFRKFSKGILFTTDVSARGVDYPNVTHVIQFGSADSRETYIHRLGRTGRAGKVGRGIIICGMNSEENQFVKRELNGLDIKRDDRYQRLVNGEVVAQDGDGGGGMKGAVKRKEINDVRLQKIYASVRGEDGGDANVSKLAKQSYRSLLGYNLTQMKNLGLRSKDEVVAYINSLAVQCGFEDHTIPKISPKLVQTLGLKGIRGLNIGRSESTDSYSPGGRGRGGGGGRGSYGRDDRNGGGRFDRNRGGRGDNPRGGQMDRRGRRKFDNEGGHGDNFDGRRRNSQQQQGGSRSSNYQQFNEYRWNSFDQ